LHFIIIPDSSNITTQTHLLTFLITTYFHTKRGATKWVNAQ